MSLMNLAGRRRMRRPQTVARPSVRTAVETEALEALTVLGTVDLVKVITFSEGNGGASLAVQGTTQEGLGLQMEFGGTQHRMTAEQAVEATKALCTEYGLVQEPVVQERVSAFGEPYKVYLYRPAGDSLF